MLTLIKGGELFVPERRGAGDILIGGGRILAVTAPGVLNLSGLEVETIEAAGRNVLPGLVDPHVHILGGGGEGGPATRAPEIRIEDIATSGVTTVIGCLGTDGITRHMSSLLAKARALEEEGVTTFIFTGSYEVPVKTITGSVRSDLVLIDKVVGAGEIAVSDHRSSQPTFEELARLAAECRVGGMLGGKAGVLHLHLGDGRRRLEYLFRLIRETEIPASQIIPTHVSRDRELFAEALKWMGVGGSVDITTGPDPEPAEGISVGFEDCLLRIMDAGLPLARAMASSDGNGSLPVFDAAGRLARLTVASERHLLRKFQDVVIKKILPAEEAVRLFSTNTAEFYGLRGKGRLAEGLDADLIMTDEGWLLTEVIAKGLTLMRNRQILVKGTFSERD